MSYEQIIGLVVGMPAMAAAYCLGIWLAKKHARQEAVRELAILQMEDPDQFQRIMWIEQHEHLYGEIAKINFEGRD